MNRFLLIGFCSVVLFFKLFQAAPVDDEVELIGPVDDADYDQEGFIPIFVVKQTSGSPSFGNFPFGAGRFPFNIFEAADHDEPEESFFGSPAVVSGEDETLCGFICTILKQFETKLTAIEDDLKKIHAGVTDEYDVNNTTYTEKVLPDGSIVKINRTVISDTSDDGTSYFFHSTSLHNVEENNPATEEDADQPFEEFPNAVPVAGEDIPEYPDDDSLNEIFQESRARRSDPFAQQMIFRHPNEISSNYYPAAPQLKPTPPHHRSLHGDTRVNDIITENGKRGSLLRLEPDSEFIRRNSHTGEIERANVWATQQIVS